MPGSTAGKDACHYMANRPPTIFNGLHGIWFRAIKKQPGSRATGERLGLHNHTLILF
jgi:hypothetical protein